jgi:hypothetical protein
MGISKAMVESTLFRARRRLSQEYDELDSGRRCLDVRAAVDGHHVRALARLGLRERRRIASHLDHCRDCQRYARMAGIDGAALGAPSAARRVAALLPVGWLPLLARRVRRGVLGRHGGSVASRTAHRTAALAESTAPGVALGRALAAAAAILAVGSGLPAAGPSRHASRAIPSIQPVRSTGPAVVPASHRHHMRGADRPRTLRTSRHLRGAAPAHRSSRPGRHTTSRLLPPRGPGATPSSGNGGLLAIPLKLATPQAVPSVPSLPSVPGVSNPVGSIAGQGVKLPAPVLPTVNANGTIAAPVAASPAATALQQTGAAAGAAVQNVPLPAPN